MPGSAYMERALTRWNVPLLGCVPHEDFLSQPTMMDFQVRSSVT